MTDDLGFGAAPESVELASLGHGGMLATLAESDTVLAVDRWGWRRAADIAGRWAAVDGMPVVERPVIADAHEALFGIEPALAEHPADRVRARWVQHLLEAPEYRALHSQTCLDPDLSELGAAAICRQWLEYAARQAKRPPASSQTGSGAPDADDEPIAKTIERLRSVGDALAAARDEVQTAQDVRDGLGIGSEPGTGQALDPAAFREHFARIRNDRLLRAIMQMAGRLRATARALQRARSRHGADELVGIEPTGDVARLVPSELAQLACGIDELELLALYRLVQRQSLGRQLQAVERLGRGPVVVSVDESGSMQGQRIVVAKALALALAWLAHHQRRWIMLAGFSAGSAWHGYTAAPRRHDHAALLAWCSHMYCGGTTLDAPLGAVPAHLDSIGAPAGRVDHIIITDAEVDVPDALRASYRAWSERRDVHTYAIVIGTRNPGDLAAVATRCWSVPSLDPDSVAVAEILSL